MQSMHQSRQERMEMRPNMMRPATAVTMPTNNDTRASKKSESVQLKVDAKGGIEVDMRSGSVLQPDELRALFFQTTRDIDTRKHNISQVKQA